MQTEGNSRGGLWMLLAGFAAAALITLAAAVGTSMWHRGATAQQASVAEPVAQR